MGTYRRVGFQGATFLSPPLGLVVGADGAGKPETMDAGLAPRRLAGRVCARLLPRGGELAEPTVRACAPPPSGASAIARMADPSPAGAPRGRQVGGTYPRRRAGCGAGRRSSKPPPDRARPPGGGTAARAGAAACAHSQALRAAITGASSMTSTSSRESFAKARHMATSSQESRGPCSAPVASSTTV